ncbi:transcriptional regulator [Bryobacterales bacterium F-183]|nr:transcriptional regulator [Bryobacterales bacterium F-183]
MKKTSKKQATVGQDIIASVQEAIAWAEGKSSDARATQVEVPLVDVRSLRRKLRLSQSQFALRFGFAAASVKNWEQGRTRPEGPARVLLAVIAKHPEAVEDALRRAS